MANTKTLKGECQHCGGHLEFPAEQIGLVADCPHCGQATELMLTQPAEESTAPRAMLVWAVVALIILGAGLAGSLIALHMAERRVGRKPAVKSTAAPVSATADVLARQGFSISAIRLEKAAGGSELYATGTLKNLTTRQRLGVKIQLELADASGRKVGTVSEYQPVMEPGAEWGFRTLVVAAKAASAKVLAVKEDQ